MRIEPTGFHEATRPTSLQAAMPNVPQPFRELFETTPPADAAPMDHAPHALSRSASASPVEGGAVSETQEAFRDFVGQTLFGQMLKSMRSTVGTPAYFHGGQTEEIFQQQMDQVLVEEISEASAAQVADPMFDLFMQSRIQ